MPACPKCGNKEQIPTRTFSVLVEPSREERGLTERKVGMYSCSSCGTKFPTVVGRQHYLIVVEDELRKMHEELNAVKRSNEELQKRIRSIEDEYLKTQKSMEHDGRAHEIRELESKVDQLESYVTHLRKDKEELEQRISKLT